MKLCMGCMEQMEDKLTKCPHCGYDETTLTQESYYLAPGSIIGGKYIVGRVLQYSGYIIKYLGMNAETNQKVTVSEYLPSEFSTRSEGELEVTIYSGDAEEQFNQGLMTFLNEANRIEQLGRVDGITQVYDCVAENDTGYVIAEYLNGQTLAEVLNAGKKYTVEEAKALILRILQGLAKVHPMDIIHCDIAPETIFLCNTGEVKLLDFGSTRYVTTANSKSLAIILKQGYAPEEQYRSRGVRGPWTDVYALGAVMYRMITGKVPAESVDRALVDELEAPSKLGIKITESDENALMNALNVYQKDRTPSAEVFMKELTSGNAKRIKVKKKKNDTGKIPIWVKGLVAVFTCVVIAGGVFVFMNRKKGDVTSENTKVATFQEPDDKTTIQSFLKTWKKNGLKEDALDVTYYYTADAKKDLITSFLDHTENNKLAGGTKWNTITSAMKKDGYSAKKPAAELEVESKEQCTFLSNWWSFCPSSDEIPYTLDDKEQDNSQPYGTVKSVSYQNKTYEPKDRESLPNPLKVADKSSLTIKIYTGPFFYVDKVKRSDFLGKDYTAVPMKYSTDPAKAKAQKGTAQERSKLIKERYYSFETNANTIVSLSDSLKEGQIYDARKTPGAIFSIVDKRLALGSTTVGDLKALGVNVKDGKGNVPAKKEIIETVRKIESKSGQIDGCFKKGDTVIVNIKLPTPKPTQAPVQQATQAPPVQQATQAPANPPRQKQSPKKKKRDDGSSHKTDSLF